MNVFKKILSTAKQANKTIANSVVKPIATTAKNVAHTSVQALEKTNAIANSAVKPIVNKLTNKKATGQAEYVRMAKGGAVKEEMTKAKPN